MSVMIDAAPRAERPARVATLHAAVACLAGVLALPGSVAAQSLGPEGALERALEASPELRAALLDAVDVVAAGRQHDDGDP